MFKLNKSKFKLVTNSPWWKREYRGTIEPIQDCEFSLILETLTGRPRVNRPSSAVTHRISGSYYKVGLKNVVPVLDFHCERLKLEDAIALQEEFRAWWLVSLRRYNDIKILTGNGKTGS